MNQYEQVFQRQVYIEDWKQDIISKQVVLILGVGGIGSIVTMNLLRLGVKKLILVDYDAVDIHNLNRQILYSNKDVGVQKIEAALNNQKFHNVGNTEIEVHDIDAVKNWSLMIQLASQSHVIYNCIDYGDYWDAAVQSLCLFYNIPMVIAGTFAQSLMAEIYIGTPCYLCMTDGLKSEFISQITKDKITKLDSLSFLPSNSKPVGKSHAVLCSTAGNFATQLYLNYLNVQDQSQTSKKILFYLTTFEILNFPIESKQNCELCGYQVAVPKIEEQYTQQLGQQEIQLIKQDEK